MKVCDGCGDCYDDGDDFCARCGGSVSVCFKGSRVLCGRYRLEKKLAEGAMGLVFEAVHLAVGSRVAVKVMQPQQQELRVAVQRFHKEARILGAVKHPHAVLITDFDVDERDGTPIAFLVTELLRGRSLSDLLDAQKTLTLDEVERIVTPLCDAVEEAHAQGIIHRDLKPSNVFLEKLRDGSEVVKVLDFGIAKLLQARASEVPLPIDLPPTKTPNLDRTLRAEILSALDDEDADDGAVASSPAPSSASSSSSAKRETSTYAGMMVGTVPYMSPEQMTGERVTRRSDVHALAVMVFEMLAGRLPFDGDDDEIIDHKLRCDEEAERPSLRELGVEVDPALDALLSRCFAVDAEQRPESLRAVADAVARAAKLKRGDAPVVDAIAQLSMRLSIAARALAALEDSALEEGAPELRARVRDTLLATGVSLDKARALLPLARRALAAPPQAQLVAAQLELDDAVATARGPLQALGQQDADGGLLLLWRRIDAFAQSVGELIEGEGDVDATASDALAAVLDAPTLVIEQAETLHVLVEKLLAKDALDAADALAEVLEERAAEVLRALTEGGPFAAQVRAGLWRHADAVLLRDLGAERQALRFVPLLAQHDVDNTDFARMVAALRDKRGAVIVEELQDPALRPALRCLLLHPIGAVRAAAAAALPVVDLWTVIAHPRTPVAVLHFVFTHLREHGHPDHQKVFFFCVRDTVAAASMHELKEALALVRSYFDVSCFHEDLLFEPLLELERGLRARADVAGVLDDSYVRAVAAFIDVGAREEAPLEQLRDVPLPIQRKLAREGRFLTTFVCHHNERVAQETVQHLLRLDDVTRYLRMVTIHRAVLTELAKRRRFFKKDAPKLALLGNPKTPAPIARPFIPLLADDQLRTLSTSRHINPDVRRLILTHLQR